MRMQNALAWNAPSPDPRRLRKTPSRATLSPKGARDCGLLSRAPTITKYGVAQTAAFAVCGSASRQGKSRRPKEQVCATQEAVF